MRILYIVPSLANKGPVRVVQQLTKALVRVGVDCEIWYLDPKVDLEFDCPARKINSYSNPDLSNFDVVHSHGIRPDFLVWWWRFCGRRFKSVTTVHNYVEADLRYQYNWIVSKIFSRLWCWLWLAQTRIVVLSQDARAYYTSRLSSEKIDVIGNGMAEHVQGELNLADKELLEKLNKSSFVIGSCAQVTSRKGLEQIIHLISRHSDCVFVLVGDGAGLDCLIDLSKSLGVSERFFPVGFRQNARDFLPYFDVIALPSRAEGFPLSFIEAAAAARPVLLSNIPVFQEIAPSNCAAFFELDNNESLDGALHMVRVNNHSLSAQVRILYEQDFVVENMANKYFHLYREIIKNG